MKLTQSEYELLLFFIGNKDRVISKSAMAEFLSIEMADLMDNAVTVTAVRTVSDTSDETALDKRNDFQSFLSSVGKGNGFGFAIVKAVCDYHDWKILYAYRHHEFTVVFM